MAWHKTKHPGIRYREHEKRRHGVSKDKYYAIYYTHNGRRYEEGLGWTSQGWNTEKALIALAELKKNQQSGEGPVTMGEKRQIEQERKARKEAERKQQQLDAITFSEFFEQTYFPHCCDNKKLKSQVAEDCLYRLWIRPVVGDAELKRISPIHIERLKKSMADAGKSARTQKYALDVVNQVFSLARTLNIYQGDAPTRKVKKPSIDNRRMRFLSHEEADKLLTELGTRSRQMHSIALLSLHCGLRANEIFCLTWDCIDWDRGQILLKDTKSGRNRMAFMTDQVKEMLVAQKALSMSSLVFTDKKGSQLREVSHTFDRAVRDLGLNEGIDDPRQRVVFHSLRHSYASWLVESGTDLYVVKKLMGHSTLAMTERYSHLSENSLKQAVTRLQGSMTKQSNVVELKRQQQ